VEQFNVGKAGLIFFGMDAVDGAGIDARRNLHPNAKSASSAEDKRIAGMMPISSIRE
jgi:hypothetical protein